MMFDGTGSVEVGTGWYLVELGQYNLVLLCIKWYSESYTLYVPALPLKLPLPWIDNCIQNVFNVINFTQKI